MTQTTTTHFLKTIYEIKEKKMATILDPVYVKRDRLSLITLCFARTKFPPPPNPLIKDFVRSTVKKKSCL